MDFISTSLSNLHFWKTSNDAPHDETAKPAAKASAAAAHPGLPSDVFSDIAATLPLRDFVSLGLTGKAIATTLDAHFPYRRATWGIFQRANIAADIPPTLQSIQSLPLERQYPMLRELGRRLQRFPDLKKADLLPIKEALDLLEKPLRQPGAAETLSRTLALCDIGMARRLATMSVLEASLRIDRNAPLHIRAPVISDSGAPESLPSAAFPSSHWPAALDSYLQDTHWALMVDALLLFIQWYTEKTTTSELLAIALANVAFEFGASDVKDNGAQVRAMLTNRFGVNTDRQWAAIDRGIADRIAERYAQDGLIADWDGFNQACEHWRPGDAAFVELAEQSALSDLSDWILTDDANVGTASDTPSIHAAVIAINNNPNSLWEQFRHKMGY